MYFVYSLLLTLVFVLLLPRFLFDAMRKGKYTAGFRQRLGSLDPVARNQPVIWVHCVSVGETQAARPLITALKARFPFHSIVVSTITRTGQELAQQVLQGQVDNVFYFPFDWGWTVRKALSSVKPAAVLIMETELWPRFLRECNRQDIPVAIVNGRLSDTSFRRYNLIRTFMTDVLRSIRLAVMQTSADAERIEALGMDPGKICVSGNLKFDSGLTETDRELAEALRGRFGIQAERVVLAASTHAPEERLILEAFKKVAEQAPETRLIIAPRHPERFGEVASLIAASGLRWTRRSAQPASGDLSAQIILLDSIGELSSIYSLTSVVFVGGSIVRHGGHNILEPAATGCAIITGAHTHNFHSIIQTFVEAGAVIQLPPLSETAAAAALAVEISKLLADPLRRSELSTRATALLEQNQGATQATIKFIEPIITNAAPLENATHNFIVEGAHTT